MTLGQNAARTHRSVYGVPLGFVPTAELTSGRGKRGSARLSQEPRVSLDSRRVGAEGAFQGRERERASGTEVPPVPSSRGSPAPSGKELGPARPV